LLQCDHRQQKQQGEMQEKADKPGWQSAESALQQFCQTRAGKQPIELGLRTVFSR